MQNEKPDYETWLKDLFMPFTGSVLYIPTTFFDWQVTAIAGPIGFLASTCIWSHYVWFVAVQRIESGLVGGQARNEYTKSKATRRLSCVWLGIAILAIGYATWSALQQRTFVPDQLSNVDEKIDELEREVLVIKSNDPIPDELAARFVTIANDQAVPTKQGDSWIELSSGRGRLFLAVIRSHASADSKHLLFDQVNFSKLLLHRQTDVLPSTGLSHTRQLDVTDANLKGAYMDEVQMRDAILRRTNLSESHLIGANLYSAVLVEADLRHADLRLADLRNAVFAERARNAGTLTAFLSGAKLDGSKLDGAIVHIDTWQTVQASKSPITGVEDCRLIPIPNDPEFAEIKRAN